GPPHPWEPCVRGAGGHDHPPGPGDRSPHGTSGGRGSAPPAERAADGDERARGPEPRWRRPARPPSPHGQGRRGRTTGRSGDPLRSRARAGGRMTRVLYAAFITALLLVGTPARAATIVVVNADGPGEGFNDATPVAPVGGNTATTLGGQRLNVFQYAADIWG